MSGAGVGKRTRGALYVHREALGHLPERERRAAREAAARAGVGPADYDVVKFAPGAVSLLSYPGFWREHFPALARAWTVPRSRGPAVRRDYAPGPSRPILHRKELLMPPGDPRAERPAELTRRLEAAGAFGDPSRIGRAGAWADRLASPGARRALAAFLSGGARPR